MLCSGEEVGSVMLTSGVERVELEVSSVSVSHLTGGVCSAIPEYCAMYVVAIPPGNVAFRLALPVFTEDLEKENCMIDLRIFKTSYIGF